MSIKTKPVITMSTLGINGNFGNQIFQYAFLRFYAQRFNLTIETPPWAGQYLFGHNDQPITQPLLPVIKEYDKMEIDVFLKKDARFINVDFWGYFHFHTKYYSPDKNFFQSLFTPVTEIKHFMDQGMQNLRSKGKTIVGIHLRRGDYVIAEKDNGWCFVAPSIWYKEWLNTIWGTLEQPVLFIASDELETVLPDFIEYNPVISKDLYPIFPNPNYYADHYVLSQCDILAISNSTFSFTASMLNNTGKLFFRPQYRLQKLVPYNPWDSYPTLWKSF